VTGRIRTYAELTAEDRSRLAEQVAAQRAKIETRLAAVRHTVAVMSGKGGVGKSFVTARLARALAAAGSAVGVLDADLHSPTAARMLGLVGSKLVVREDGVVPPAGAGGVRVISTDLLLAEGAPLAWREPAHEKFVWRGTLEAGMLREFLGDVAWGKLDLLLVDLPPGTNRLDTLVELVPNLSGVIAVTIPSDASLRAVSRALRAVQAQGVRVLGIVENMSGYACPSCGETGPLFAGDAAAKLAEATSATVLARLPFHAAAQRAADTGSEPGADSLAAAFDDLARALTRRLETS
jgi:ATP-binding protein involved in chromosome partitioning